MANKLKSSKRLRASLVAGVLAGAIALTGTFAWTNRSQQRINEILVSSNPGGRMHDDFNGTTTKDIYAENFTDVESGSPVFVRVKLLEYMEVGEEAGVNRTDASGNPVAMDSRKVTPLVDGADINDTDTWRVHKPDAEGDTDPFHEYWKWEQSGKTTYMPTFNKNKDSLSVDVNGSYVGKDGDFVAGKPYDDYVSYTAGEESEELYAYYDADGNDKDENYQADGSFVGEPGAGGVKKVDDTTENPNYEEKKEKHTAQETLNSLGVITMQAWIDAGKPVCNKWVWDTDGWFYWPEPIQPQTATGLLLDRVTQGTVADGRCYYAIDLVGQFADSDWGKPKVTAPGENEGDPEVVVSEATGFYIDGITDNAVLLLQQAANDVEVVGDTWYLNMGNNTYKKILDDEGKLSTESIYAGDDGLVGTTDDRVDVVYVESGVKVGDNNYGNYFLPARDDPYQPYYLAAGPDGELGTADDVRLWVPDGNTFPDGVVDQIADSVTIAVPGGAAAEVQMGKTLDLDATVKLGETDVTATEPVVWSVAPQTRVPLAAGTTIDETTGALTVAEDEPNPVLVVTAKVKRNDKVLANLEVPVLGKYWIKIWGEFSTAAPDHSDLKVPAIAPVGGELGFSAYIYQGDEPIPPEAMPTEEPADTTVSVGASEDNGATITPVEGVVLSDSGYLEVADSYVPQNLTDGDTFYFKMGFTFNGDPISGVLPITVVGPSSLELSLKDDAPTEVKVGKSIGLKSAVKYNTGRAVRNNSNQNVTWEIVGDHNENTTVTTNSIYEDYSYATLTVAPGETATTLKLKATSQVNPSISDTIDIAVTTTNTLANTDPGSEETVWIDDIEWYILAKSEDKSKALILSKYALEGRAMNDGSGVWKDSTLRTYANGEEEGGWLYDKPNLKAMAQVTDVNVRTADNAADTFDTTQDKVFLLSEADVFGTEKYGDITNPDARCYTTGSKLTIPGGTQIKLLNGDFTSWWLRSPQIESGLVCTAEVDQNGARSYSGGWHTYGFRPALWVAIP